MRPGTVTIRRTGNQQSDDRGASAVEYGLIVAAIAAIIVAVIFAIGTATGALFDESCESIATEVDAANNDCPSAPVAP